MIRKWVRFGGKEKAIVIVEAENIFLLWDEIIHYERTHNSEAVEIWDFKNA